MSGYKIVSVTPVQEGNDLDIVYKKGAATIHVLGIFGTLTELAEDLEASKIDLIDLSQTCLVAQARENSINLMRSAKSSNTRKSALIDSITSEFTESTVVHWVIDIYEKITEQTSVNRRILLVERFYQRQGN